MRKKAIFFMALFGVLAGAVLVYNFVNFTSADLNSTAPNDYESKKACEKQDILWQNIEDTTYQTLPELRTFGLKEMIQLGMQAIGEKGRRQSDFAPPGWYKYLHARGAIAKVKIIAKNSQYSGVFQGADCALLRLSLTYRTAENSVLPDMPVAPGLALKILRDGIHSANVSALVSLDGQGRDFNFFTNPMSNIVPIGDKLGQKGVHKIFRKVSSYPEELRLEHMAKIDSRGQSVAEVAAPRQIFFVPSRLNFPSQEHEIRYDFLTIKPNTLIYKIYAYPIEYQDFNYTDYNAEKAAEFLSKSEHIADIVTTSAFVASEFGDDGIFFRHQLRP